jgi:BlaI family transcriptional regulator, penicillinase repressor
MARFTAGELAVMKLLWEHGELKPADVQRQFPWKIKNPALRSHLSILLAKGHVTRRKIGKAFFYQAATQRENAFQSTLRELLDTYCGGSVRSLLVNLIQSEDLSGEELREVERLAQQPVPNSKKKPVPEKKSTSRRRK